MLYWLTNIAETHVIFNVFRYITFRTGGAVVTAGLFVFMFGPWIIDNLRLRQGKGQVGSSRVDLQACKLEYSIVSPK